VWSDGVVQANVTASPATRAASPVTSTTYTVTSVADAVCMAGTSSGSATVTVSSISGDLVVSAGSSGNLYSGPPGMASYTWSITSGNGTIATVAGPANQHTVSIDALAPGGFTLALAIVDANGSFITCTQAVIVEAAGGFQFDTCTVSRSVLFPPDHRMESITVTWATSGASGPVAVAIILESDQPDDARGGGDGHTVGDLNGVPAADKLAAPHFLLLPGAFGGSGSTTFAVRRERQGALRCGRHYRVTVRATATVAGSSQSIDCSHCIVVPHDLGAKRACRCGGGDCPLGTH
jgi:hypothetical protein